MHQVREVLCVSCVHQERLQSVMLRLFALRATKENTSMQAEPAIVPCAHKVRLHHR